MQAAAVSIASGVLSFAAFIALPAWQALAWTNRVPIISPLRLLGRIVMVMRAAGSLLPFVLKEAALIWRQNWAEALRAKKAEW